MPKMKTNSGAKKRFKKTAGGLKRKMAFRRHILTKKSSKTKRQLRGTTMVNAVDVKEVKLLLPGI